MSGSAPLHRVFTADDPAGAEAVREALSRAGIDARVLADDDGDGGVRIEVLVPAGTEARAEQIIATGDWPRLA